MVRDDEGIESFKRRIVALVYARASIHHYAHGCLLTSPEFGKRIADDKQMLSEALSSHVKSDMKVSFLTGLGVRISPNDEAALATDARVAEALAAKATAAAVFASATAASVSAGATVAEMDHGSTDPERTGRLAVATANRLSAAGVRVTANHAVLCAVRLAEEALLERHFRYKGSALGDVLKRGDYPQLRTLIVCGLKLTRYTAWRAIKDIILNDDLGMQESLELLRCILRSDPALDVCYVSPEDDNTVVGLAVELQRVDMVEALLDHTPKAVHVTGASYNTPPALRVGQWNARFGAARSIEQHACAYAKCVQKNCNNGMNKLLYARGADPGFVSYGGNTNRGMKARLCCSGRKEVADAMDRRMREFLLQLQIIFLGRVAVHSCPLKLLTTELFRDEILPHLGWGLTVSPCTEVSLAMSPWFPRRPPASWKVGPPPVVPSSANMSDSE